MDKKNIKKWETPIIIVLKTNKTEKAFAETENGTTDGPSVS